ncbi:MAG: cation-transporting P-type ATPase [Candidatus Bathyarchaeia archaeon]
MKKNNWHALESNAVLSLLSISRNGISEEEVKKRLEQYGPNVLKEEKKPPVLKS